MKDWLAPGASVIASLIAVLGVLIGPAISFRARLRKGIREDLEMLSKLSPASSAIDALQDSLDVRIRALAWMERTPYNRPPIKQTWQYVAAVDFVAAAIFVGTVISPHSRDWIAYIVVYLLLLLGSLLTLRAIWGRTFESEDAIVTARRNEIGSERASIPSTKPTDAGS